MSASLVGSEMCIRDRRCHSLGSVIEGVPEEDQVLRLPELPAADGDVAVPVSYTHLTLPTICSV
eukprot:341954-Alexandrium_andersonii.AAC.1